MPDDFINVPFWVKGELDFGHYYDGGWWTADGFWYVEHAVTHWAEITPPEE